MGDFDNSLFILGYIYFTYCLFICSFKVLQGSNVGANTALEFRKAQSGPKEISFFISSSRHEPSKKSNQYSNIEPWKIKKELHAPSPVLLFHFMRHKFGMALVGGTDNVFFGV